MHILALHGKGHQKNGSVCGFATKTNAQPVLAGFEQHSFFNLAG
jgi:hypothetical protein